MHYFFPFLKIVHQAVEPLERNEEKLQHLLNMIVDKLIPETSREFFQLIDADYSHNLSNGIRIIIECPNI